MLRNGSDQTQSVIVKTQFAHPNGRTVRFGAVLPLATWQTELDLFLDGLRDGVMRNFSSADPRPHSRESFHTPSEHTLRR